MPAQPRKDGGASVLRADLTEALIDVPFMNAQSDRRLLIDLIRRDVIGFPQVDDHPDARLHAVQIAMRCLEHSGGLRGLVGALDIMAPDATGTRRVKRVIEAATLQSLMPDAVVKQAHDILRRATEAGLDPMPLSVS